MTVCPTADATPFEGPVLSEGLLRRAVGRTQAVSISNRLLYRNGQLEHLENLQAFFWLTDTEIKSEFYKTEKKLNLLGEQDEVVTKVVKPIQHITNLYIRQLKTVWKHVTEQPLRLDNTKGRPLFHLVFASNNAPALRIAKDIITVK